MFDNPLIVADTLALSISAIICALAAVRAFTSRRFLTTPLYRNRALWTGTVALILIVVDALGIFLDNTSSAVTIGIVPTPGTPEFYVFVALTGAFSAVVFAWIDSTIRIALELDFLHRDALRWRSARPVAGIALVLGTIFAQFASTTWVFILSIALLVPAASYLASVLAVGGSRVRVQTMRRYIRWMGFLVASLLLLVVTSSLNGNLNFPLAFAAFFLYGMSTSLLKTAPLRVATSAIPASQNETGPMDQGPTQGPR